jgi:hypothetical protein
MKALGLSRLQPALPGLTLACLAPFGPWLEASMSGHMGIELPALFILGCWSAFAAGGIRRHLLDRWNGNGLPGLLFSQCVLAVWMLPVAIDRAVLGGGIAMAKVTSVVLAGALAYESWRVANPVVQSFFVLNGCWMALTTGLLYESAPQQLCSIYLVDQQHAAGRAVVAWALLALGSWFARWVRMLRSG